jgi:hypothetical protein
VRSELTTSAVSFAWAQLTSRLSGPMRRRTLERAQVVRDEMRDIKRRYADDPDARQGALVELYKRRGFSPLRSSAPTLISSALLNVIPALLSEYNQRLPERLAGIVVIVDG